MHVATPSEHHSVSFFVKPDTMLSNNNTKKTSSAKLKNTVGYIWRTSPPRAPFLHLKFDTMPSINNT